MKDELRKAYIDRVNELLNLPIRDAKIQIDFHYDEPPTIRYDITEIIIPKEESEDRE